MTENLLQKLEEKMMMLLSEVEDLRKDVQRISHENSTLKFEKENNSKKLQDLISLLDSVSAMDSAMNNLNVSIPKPVLVQG